MDYVGGTGSGKILSIVYGILLFSVGSIFRGSDLLW